jgi:hypothetical protein
MHFLRAVVFCLALGLLPFPFSAKGSEASALLPPHELKCEYARNPGGVDVPEPRLFWQLESDVPGQSQTAYQVLVASSRELLARNKADRWNSGKVRSDETIHIRYAGRRLKSSEQVFWKVRAWDKQGKESGWSEIASWTMGLLSPQEWKGKWITSPQAAANANSNHTVLLRKDFAVRSGLKRATVHVCGLGHYEMLVNGRKIGADILSPGWSKYDKTCLYDTYELTEELRAGANTVGMSLANGMYNVVGGRYHKFTGSFGPLKMICQFRLEYQDGTVETVVSDQTWRTFPGPITFSCVFGGEDYDARLYPEGWDGPGFQDGQWQNALAVDGLGGELRGMTAAAPPIRAFETLVPVNVNRIATNSQVYDLGQNAALIPEIKVKGPPGSVIRIIPAELLGTNGSVDRVSVGGSQSYWQYTLAGRPAGKTAITVSLPPELHDTSAPPAETWTPKFFYHGGRFLQVECSSPEGEPLPEVLELRARVVHAMSEPVGEFNCSSDLFNRIRKLIRWAQRSNMMSLMTDCPHREKLGWLEETHLNGPALRYEFDLARLLTKTLNDMADSQLPNGLVPDIAPEFVVFKDGFRDSPEWGSAMLLVPWQQYEFAGDIEMMKRYYDHMKQYVTYLGSRATNHIVSHGLGDWYDIGPKEPGVAQLTPIPLTATAFYYYDCLVLSRAAGLLKKPSEAREYADLSGRIKAAFNEKFFDPKKRVYATGSQAANAIPLVMGLVEPPDRKAVAQAIVDDIRNRGNALTAGDVGYRYLLCALAQEGRSDVIFDMNHQSAKPGYGYMLEQGATSLTEAWNARRESSQNHFMLGQINEWFYHDVAGIQNDSGSPGFKKIRIKPALVGDLTFAEAAYNSIRGRITSSWRKDGHAFTLKTRIPTGATATVFVPSREDSRIDVQGENQRRLVRSLPRQDGCAVYFVPSGAYEFHSRLQ